MDKNVLICCFIFNGLLDKYNHQSTEKMAVAIPIHPNSVGPQSLRIKYMPELIPGRKVDQYNINLAKILAGFLPAQGSSFTCRNKSQDTASLRFDSFWDDARQAHKYEWVYLRFASARHTTTRIKSDPT
jgi:hypothetical protein